MSECGRCGSACHVRDGDEFNEGDWCHPCLIAVLQRKCTCLEALLACYRTGKRPSERLLDQLAEIENEMEGT